VRFSLTCGFEPCGVRKSECWLTPLEPGAFSFVASDPESTSGRSRSDCLPQTACSGRGVQTYGFYRRECDPAIAHREFLRGLKARQPNPESATTRDSLRHGTLTSSATLLKQGAIASVKAR